MFRSIVVILIPIVLIGLVLIAIIIGLVLKAIRTTIMAFKGDTDDEVENDGFLVEYNSLNISALF